MTTDRAGAAATSPSIVRSPAVVERRCGAVVLLMGRQDKELRRLEGTAAATWLALEVHSSFSSLAEAIGATVAGVDAEAVRAGLAAALDALAAAGLIESDGEAPWPTTLHGGRGGG